MGRRREEGNGKKKGGRTKEEEGKNGGRRWEEGEWKKRGRMRREEEAHQSKVSAISLKAHQSKVFHCSSVSRVEFVCYRELGFSANVCICSRTRKSDRNKDIDPHQCFFAIEPQEEQRRRVVFILICLTFAVSSSFVGRIPSFQPLQVNMSGQEIQEPNSPNDRRAIDQSQLKLRRWHWWILVAVNIFFVVVGQTTAVLLGRFYYDKGGNSTWMATLVQTAAFPVLFIPLFFLSSKESSITPKTTISVRPSVITLSLIYVPLGILVAGDNMMYSVGLLYLSASTYSLICASQLAFNAVFAFFINSQKFTALVFNAVVILSLSSALIGFHSDSTEPAGVSTGKYILGFMCTLGASAVYSLLLSLMQLSFQKVLKRETFSVVLEMQIFTSFIATCCSIIGLFASGEWRTLKGEMYGFEEGRLSYVMTLVWTAVSWQVASVGVVGLIFVVSSLFSNVISTLALALGPIAAVIFFHDNMDGVKVVAMLMAFWGFASYLYQQYLDDSKLKAAEKNVNEVPNGSTSERLIV
ncbi:hypothetical protein NE237_025673 [Protea cynaroides]|uniref:Probable purine permease n=1 Tax=Protea cynaroides TaxID=273540 RepID=A0A9Q0K0R2_9MAGN|nr:hypothetical protein NE237_025673 [Protea cynaroides]